MRTEQKHKLALKRRWRIRKKISGTKERPRMSVCFTNKNIHVQFIDDSAGVTLAAASTRLKAGADAPKARANAAGAKASGGETPLPLRLDPTERHAHFAKHGIQGLVGGDLVQMIYRNFNEMNTVCYQAEESAMQAYASFAVARQEYEHHMMAA